MDDTAKYLIHATITADGVVERSDVVGAIFGQTEGLLGDDLDLRDLQQSSKVGRIDVEVDSEGGRSTGEVTIATSLDRVETAILAASLETISRVGPCQSTLEVTEIEDVREAKRRAIVERAKELLTEQFDDSIMSSAEIMDEVREAVRVADITEYRGLPAGPRVVDSDAIIVVEGRADVLQLLRSGVKNAVAVEGTNVPDAIADLTQERTVTAFLDGDRGGELILRELLQIGEVDHVAFAPEGKSVEDLSRREVMRALREKVPLSSLPAEGNLRAAVTGGGDSGNRARESQRATEAPAPTRGAGDGADVSLPPTDADAAGDGDADSEAADAGTGVDADSEADPGVSTDGNPTVAEAARDGEAAVRADAGASTAPPTDAVADEDDADRGDVERDASNGAASAGAETAAAGADADSEADAGSDADAGHEGRGPAGADDADGGDGDESATLGEHVRAVVGDASGVVRLLDESYEPIAEADAGEAFAAIRDAEPAPFAVVLDGELTQRLLDVAAQRGVEHVVARSTGEFVKRPVDVRVRTAEQLAAV